MRAASQQSFAGDLSLEARARLIGDAASNIMFAGDPDGRREGVAKIALEHLRAIAAMMPAERRGR